MTPDECIAEAQRRRYPPRMTPDEMERALAAADEIEQAMAHPSPTYRRIGVLLTVMQLVRSGQRQLHVQWRTCFRGGGG